MDEQTMEIHCLRWSSNGRIPDSGCYTDLERAVEHATYANTKLRWWHRFDGGEWRVRTLTVKMGKKQKK